MSRLKICHLTFDMRIGGAEQVIRNLVVGTNKNLFECSILCIEQPIGPFGRILVEQGIPVNCIPRREGFDLGLIVKIRRFLLDSRIDVLHCHQYTPWVYGALASLGTRTRIIFTEHGRFYPDRRSWKRRLVNPVLLRLTERITAISIATRRALVEFEYLPESGIDVIYNGIQPLDVAADKVANLRAELSIPGDAQVIGTIARLDPVKNQQMMLQSFHLVCEDFPRAILLIVGDGEEMAALKRKADDLGISKRIIFTGYIDNPAYHLGLMDMFLLSSLTEGTSMTLLEAMSIGKPCVVTDAGGNSEIIEHGFNGMVTPSNQAEEFANSISRLLSNPSLRSEMGSNALRRFRKLFDGRRMVEKFENHYLNRLIGQNS